MEAKITADLLPLARPISQLVHDPRNARTHNAKNLQAIRDSLAKFEQRKPVVVRRSDMRVIAGNGTMDAALALGWTHLACVLVDDDDTTAAAYGLADNRTAELAEWDDETLAALMAELDEAGASEGLGWTDREVTRLLDEAARGEAGEDPGAMEPPANPVSVAGGVYRLGPHVLVCGDCTDPAVWDKALEGRRPALCATDPPYGVGFGYDVHQDTPEALDRLVAGVMPLILARCERALITPGNSNQRRYPPPAWTLCWVTPTATGRTPWGFSGWQPIMAYGSDPFLANGRGCQPDTWGTYDSSAMGDDAKARGEGAAHPCSKPLNFWTWLVERGSVHREDLIMDPFMGSGTTLIVAAKLGKVAAGIELSPAYCDVIRRRWGAWARSNGAEVGDGL